MQVVHGWGRCCTPMAKHMCGCGVCKLSPLILDVPIPAVRASGDVALAFVVVLEEMSF